MPRIIHCAKLKREAEGLDAPPCPGEQGRRIYERVSKEAWLEWLEQQKQLINETRLNLADPHVRRHLAEQMERHLFGGERDQPVSITARTLRALSIGRMHLRHAWAGLRERLVSALSVRKVVARLALAGCAALAVVYLGSGFFSVRPGEVGVGLRFGQIVAPALSPGVHYRLPWPFGSHHVIPKDRVQRVEYSPAVRSQVSAAVVPPSRTGWGPAPGAQEAANTWFQKEAAPDELFLVTGDGQLIDLRWAVQYRIADAVAYTFNVAEPDVFVRSASLAALRSVVARIAIDEVYTSQRSRVEERVAGAIQASLDTARAGIEVLSFHLLYVHAPSEVHDAFRDVASAQEDKLRTINRAHTFAVETVSQAKGEAAAMMEQALGFKEQQLLHAQGDAAGFLLRLHAYRSAPELTRFRLQVEAIEATLPGLPKFVTPDAKEVRDFDMWLLQPVGPARGR